MGMSASQARLIALTERMNDIEYQGQQINQQRTTLSNQVNALYNTLLDMKVPTPPSTSDFTKTEYSGVINASKFTVGTVTPNGSDNNGKNLYNINLNFKAQGLAVEKSMYTATATYTPKQIKLAPATDNYYVQNILEQKNTYVDLSSVDQLNNSGQDIYVQIDKANYSKLTNNPTVYSAVPGKTGEIKEEASINTLGDDVATIFVKINVSDIADFDTDGKLIGPNQLAVDLGLATAKGADGTFNLGYIKTEEKTTSILEPKSGNITDDDIRKLLSSTTTFYFINGDGKAEKVTAETLSGKTYEDVLEMLQVTSDSGKEVDNAAYTNSTYSIPDGNSGSIPVYDNLEDAQKALGSNYSQYITALHHSFPDIPESEIASRFKVYITSDGGQQVPHFIPTTEFDKLTTSNSEISGLSVYEFDKDGTYDETQTKEGCYLQFDTDGQITKVGIPNVDGSGHTWIDLTVSTVSDDKAYKDAFNKYEYDKALYDKKQQEINAKTSIVQSEDKSLELKLTRLDNERNAVNTELEAVKKVVKDNIDKSYKTFNG